MSLCFEAPARSELHKRGREAGDDGHAAAPDCSPHRVVLIESPASKRTRTTTDCGAASSSAAASPFSHAASDGAHTNIDISSALRQRCDPATGEPLFTLEQVKDIVRRAVDEKERCLRGLYDRILQEKLQEQFRAFAKFNEDYISRQLKSGDLSYCS